MNMNTSNASLSSPSSSNSFTDMTYGDRRLVPGMNSVWTVFSNESNANANVNANTVRVIKLNITFNLEHFNDVDDVLDVYEGILSCNKYTST